VNQQTRQVNSPARADSLRQPHRRAAQPFLPAGQSPAPSVSLQGLAWADPGRTPTPRVPRTRAGAAPLGSRCESPEPCLPATHILMAQGEGSAGQRAAQPEQTTHNQVSPSRPRSHTADPSQGEGDPSHSEEVATGRRSRDSVGHSSLACVHLFHPGKENDGRRSQNHRITE